MEHTTATITELIELFDNEIRFDAHSILIKFGRSEARKELESLGRSAFVAIADHLQNKYQFKKLDDVDKDVLTGWRLLLSGMLTQPPDMSNEDVLPWINACKVEAPRV